MRWDKWTRKRQADSALDVKRRRLAAWLGHLWACYTYARRIEPHWLEVTRTTVFLPRLPSAFDGLRIVHLSDFHAGRRVPAALLAESVELANRQRPDLIALTGDFVHAGYRYIEPMAEMLGRLRAHEGIYAVLGNHDFSVRHAWRIRARRRLHLAIETALWRRGITVLRNSWRLLQRHGQQLAIVGVDDLWSGQCDVPHAFGRLPGSVPAVLLAHNPRVIERLGESTRCDLVLSGHTHGGQVHLRHVGPLFLARRYRPIAAGLCRHRGCQLYVHRGVGYSFRLRYRVRPEVAVLELRRG